MSLTVPSAFNPTAVGMNSCLPTTSSAKNQPPVETFPPNPTVDFKVGRLALGQDESELESGPRYVLLVYDIESSGSESLKLTEAADHASLDRCLISRQR